AGFQPPRVPFADQRPGAISRPVRERNPAEDPQAVGLSPTWVIVLVKDFDSAKQRLGPALDPAARRKLAQTTARRAIRAAAAGDHRLVVAGSEEAAELARKLGA